MTNIRSVITGTGAYIPTIVKKGIDFTVHNFYAEDNKRIETDPLEVVRKFEQITGIAERRYVTEDMQSSDMAAAAAKIAIEDAGCDPETIDQIIVAQILATSLNTPFKPMFCLLWLPG